MQFVNNKMEQDLVLVSMIISEIHTRVVDLNVFIVQIVRQTKHVLEINVLILVLEYVELMRFVQLLVMYRLVTVYKVMLEILSRTVNLNRQVR